jgi:prepilin-type N-terminal cleavage/methylation domain-containing protein
MNATSSLGKIHRTRRAFTLVEVMIVVAVVAVLSLLASFVLGRIKDKAAHVLLQNNLRQLFQAKEYYFSETGAAGPVGVKDLIKEGYLKQSIEDRFFGSGSLETKLGWHYSRTLMPNAPTMAYRGPKPAADAPASANVIYYPAAPAPGSAVNQPPTVVTPPAQNPPAIKPPTLLPPAANNQTGPVVVPTLPVVVNQPPKPVVNTPPTQPIVSPPAQQPDSGTQPVVTPPALNPPDVNPPSTTTTGPEATQPPTVIVPPTTTSTPTTVSPPAVVQPPKPPSTATPSGSQNPPATNSGPTNQPPANQPNNNHSPGNSAFGHAQGHGNNKKS